MGSRRKLGVFGVVFAFVLISVIFYPTASAEGVPEWIKKTALWYGQDTISETEFLNAIKFLIENNFINLEEQSADDSISENIIANVLIPNGNFDIANTGFYIPLNLEISPGSTVVWKNDDSVPHTIQSQNDKGEIIGLFNSAPLQTGETFEFKFEDAGIYNYFCSLHPWRVGIITVR